MGEGLNTPAVLASVLLLVVATGGVMGSVAADSTVQTAEPADSGPDVDGNGTVVDTVPLATGGTVAAVEVDGEIEYRVDSDRPTQTVEMNGSTYVFPVDVDFDRYDPELFNVTRLRADPGVEDGIPVIVTMADQPGALSTEPAGLDVTRRLPDSNAVAGTFDPTTEEPAVGGLSASSRIESVAYDARVTLDLENATEQSAVDRARAEYGVSGEGVTIAIIDSGVNESHPDIDDEVVEKQFIEGDVGAQFHGTHVAGIAVGDGTASNGTYVGVAPNASIMDLDVFAGGVTRMSAIADAVDYADANGADVASMSLGGPPTETRATDMLAQTVQRAVDNGTHVVISAGNSGPSGSTIGTPGIARGAITVGASGPNGSRVASYSSRGPTPVGGYVKPDIVAPGTNIYSANNGFATGKDYVAISGTSMAAPMVSGTAALVLEAQPDLNTSELKSRLVSTADPLGTAWRSRQRTNPEPATVYDEGGGQLNATEALSTELSVMPGTLDFGRISVGESATKTVTITNDDDSAHEVTLDTRTTDLTGEPQNGSVSLGRTALEVPANGSATVALTVDSESLSTGIYGTRLSVTDTTTGERHSTSAGFVVGYNVTVKKETLAGESATNDTAQIIAHTDGGFDKKLGQFDDGVLNQFSLSKTVSVLSSGVTESTDTPVISTATSRDVTDGPITISEQETTPLTLDERPLEGSAGVEPVSTAVSGSLLLTSSDLAREFRASIQSPGSSEHTVRVSPRFREATSRYALAESTPGKPLDTPQAYFLQFKSSAFSTEQTFTPDPSSLDRTRVTYFRTRTDANYTVSVNGLGGFLDIGDRQFQTIKSTSGTPVEVVQAQRRNGSLESFLLQVAPERSPATMSIQRQPAYGLIGTRIDDVSGTNSTVRVSFAPEARGFPFTDQSVARSRTKGTVVNLTLTVDGSVRGNVSGELRWPPSVFGGPSVTFEAGDVDAGDAVGTALEVDRPTQELSPEIRIAQTGTVVETDRGVAVLAPQILAGSPGQLTPDNAIPDTTTTMPVFVITSDDMEMTELKAAVSRNGTGPFDGAGWQSADVTAVREYERSTSTQPGVLFEVTLDGADFEAGEKIDVAVRGSTGNGTTTLTMRDAFRIADSQQAAPGDVTGDGNAAIDVDGDGIYEDVDGDGDLDVADAQALFARIDSIESVEAFDADGDGTLTEDDARWLFDEYLSAMLTPDL